MQPLGASMTLDPAGNSFFPSTPSGYEGQGWEIGVGRGIPASTRRGANEQWLVGAREHSLAK
ncbi:MAG: hypothetical protein OSA44_00870 [Nitrospinaceae bacterium]|nr:hypothetical protein [Nitrospinaceae bacterium]